MSTVYVYAVSPVLQAINVIHDILSIVQVPNPSTGQPASVGFATFPIVNSTVTDLFVIIRWVFVALPGTLCILAMVAIAAFRYLRKNKQRILSMLGNIHLNDKHVTVLPTAPQPEPQTVIGTQHQSWAYDERVLQSPHGHAPSAYHPPSHDRFGMQHQSWAYDESVLQSSHGHAPSAYSPSSHDQLSSILNLLK
jgi:hypothetical protein